MRIPDEKIEEIRAAADIVDVIGGFVRLQRTGKSYKGLCPFHQEKTPSFNVNPEKNLFKCFGCGKGGNVFSFLMEIEKLSFVEAVRQLAERYSIALPEATPEDRAKAEQRDALYDVLRFAARFFYDALHSDLGEYCRKYLEKRGWGSSIQKRFGVGYAPASWDALRNSAHEQGFSDELLVEAGLIVPKDDGSGYDRFRNRLIFPIFSPSGKVIAFGARALAKDDQPKYLNSPETAVYAKSRVLYGFPMAVKGIRERDAAIILEGYADVMSLAQVGITNVLATSGTALTREQVQLLSRYTSNVIFLYDSDAAGAGAMERSLDLFLERDIIPQIVMLPEGDDPDSFVQEHGKEALDARLAAPQSFIDFVTHQYRSQGKLDSPDSSADAVKHIVGLLAKIDDRIKREMYVHHVSEVYGIYESVLYKELEKHSRPSRRRDPDPPPSEEEALEDVAGAGYEPVPKNEREFLSVLLEMPEEDATRILLLVYVELFHHPSSKRIIVELMHQLEDHGHIDLAQLQRTFEGDPSMQSVFADLLVQKDIVSERWSDIQTVTETDRKKVLLDAYKSLLLGHITKETQVLQRRLAAVRGDEAEERQISATLLMLRQVKTSTLRANSFTDLPEAERLGVVSFPQDE